MVAWLLCGILGLITLLYLYWAVGGTWLTDKASPIINGKPLIHMDKMRSLGAATGCLIIAAVPVVSMRPLLRKSLLLLMMAAFAYRAVGDFKYYGFFKSVKDSPFAIWDTRVYSPLSVLLAVLAAILVF